MMLPQDIKAERALLGSILIDPESYIIVSDFLQADDFYREAHREIYRVVEYLVERHEVPDMISISDELSRRRMQFSHDEDNFSYMASMVNDACTSRNAESYAHIIEELAVRRRLINAAGLIAASAQTDEAEDALEQAEEQIFTISQKRNTSPYTSIASVMETCMENLSIVYEKNDSLIGLPTGFTDIDRALKGLRRKALYILAARPGMGKTSWMLNVAANVAKQGKRVAIFSLEMGKEELGIRFVSMESGIDGSNLQTGWIEEDQWERVTEVMGMLSEQSILIDETGGLTIAQLRSRSRQMKQKHGLDLIIIDYLGLLTVKKDGKPLENRVQEISEISRSLKVLAKDLDVPVLALAQLSREVEKRASKVPQLSDLRDSGSIEQDADVVMFIYRDDAYNPETERKNIADIIIGKNRHGPTGEVSLYFDRPLTRFRNLDITSPSI